MGGGGGRSRRGKGRGIKQVVWSQLFLEGYRIKTCEQTTDLFDSNVLQENRTLHILYSLKHYIIEISCKSTLSSNINITLLLFNISSKWKQCIRPPK